MTGDLPGLPPGRDGASAGAQRVDTYHPEIIAVALLVVVVILIWGTLKYWLFVLGHQPFDYAAHIRLADEMARTGVILSPHFLTQGLMIALTYLIPGLSLAASAWVVDTLFYVFAAIVIYGLLRASGGGPSSTLAGLACGGLTVGLLLAWPIALLFPLDRHMYFGYIGTSNVYHNPSQIVLKPLALLLFWYAVRVFSPPTTHSFKTTTALLALLTVLSSIAKPSYIICLLPALAVAGAYRRYTKRPLNWPLAMAGIIVPSLVILGWQYLITYSWLRRNPVETGVALAPFVVFGAVSSWLFPKLLLSILFPVSVVALYSRAALGDIHVRFAWLNFLIGISYTYLLSESGDRLQAGNFAWSGQITCFILFVATTVFMVRRARMAGGNRRPLERRTLSDRRFLVCMGVFGLHVISGAIWYGLFWFGVDPGPFGRWF